MVEDGFAVALHQAEFQGLKQALAEVVALFHPRKHRLVKHAFRLFGLATGHSQSHPHPLASPAWAFRREARHIRRKPARMTSQVIASVRRGLYVWGKTEAAHASPNERSNPMSNVNELVVSYLAAWNERDAKRRRDLVAKTWLVPSRLVPRVVVCCSRSNA